MDNQQNMAEQTKALTNEQIAKVEEVLKRLVVFSRNNSVAIVLLRNMKMAKKFEEKRKWLTMIYAQTFQTLSMINMAISNEDTIQVFETKLDDLFRKKE